MIPNDQSIFHITPIDALKDIAGSGYLYSNTIMEQWGTGGTSIGMASLKERRKTLPVHCHPGTCVAEYVPFYFCPRSVMLYLIYRANHRELHYRGGQDQVLHLEFDLDAVINWANANGRKWAFSLSNASAYYAQFRASRAQLVEIDWDAVIERDWQPQEIKEAKQAEFLVYEKVPWNLVSRIGVRSLNMGHRVLSIIGSVAHRPKVVVMQDWYY